MLKHVNIGVFLCRYATRVFWGVLTQEPPRSTRDVSISVKLLITFIILPSEIGLFRGELT